VKQCFSPRIAGVTCQNVIINCRYQALAQVCAVRSPLLITPRREFCHRQAEFFHHRGHRGTEASFRKGNFGGRDSGCGASLRWVNRPCGVLPSDIVKCQELRTNAASRLSISTRRAEKSGVPISCPGARIGGPVAIERSLPAAGFFRVGKVECRIRAPGTIEILRHSGRVFLSFCLPGDRKTV